jgi:predicted lipid-binding transport protein (Tim44 family)
LDKQAAELEGSAQSAFFGVPPSNKPQENLSTLNQHFAAIFAVADSADAAPTTQATTVYQELEGALDNLLTRWKKIQESDLPALNASLKKAGLEEINPRKPSASQPADADTEDEP